MILRHIIFLGPSKEPAILNFSPGLNLIYGASETGKSFVVESIDFMLGGKKPIRDIPERNGYSMILLAFETEDGSFTVQRSVDGGNFLIYEGIHAAIPMGVEGKVLSEKHSSENEDNLSATLLKKIKLDGKVVKKTATTTRSLSFRDIVRLCVIEETEIQKKASPIESGQYTLRTVEYSVFKLLLTGIDDSAFVPDSKAEKAKGKEHDVDLLTDLITNYKNKIAGELLDKDAAQRELERIATEIENQKSILKDSESQLNEKINARNAVKYDLEIAETRYSEINELEQRFHLLMNHYDSDLERLEALKESGSLMEVLIQTFCPLCGADPQNSRLHLECEGNLSKVVEASDAESKKIGTLKAELTTTVDQLRVERTGYDQLLPKLRGDVTRITGAIESISSALLNERNVYSELVDRKYHLQFMFSIAEEIEVLQSRKKEIEKMPQIASAKVEDRSQFSRSILDKFSQVFENLLRAWNFPDADRVYFDEPSRDMVISGKLRTSRGKGMRSITHAAFTIALLEFCRSNELPHPGFVVVDSPLLAYRAPEETEDDLSGTDVQNRFYDYLLNLEDAQIIVIENVTPPENVIKLPASVMFSKNAEVGRYGFFPSKQPG